MQSMTINIHLGTKVPEVKVIELSTCNIIEIEPVAFFVDDERTLRNFRNSLVQKIDCILDSSALDRKEHCPHV